MDNAEKQSLVEEVERLLAAMPPGKWIHDRYRNEHGWWSALVQERDFGPITDPVIRLLATCAANQEKGGDLIEFMVRARKLLPKLVTAVRKDDAKSALVVESDKYSITNRPERSSTGGPLLSEFYGPFWIIGAMSDTDAEPVALVPDPGDGSALPLAKRIVDFLNSVNQE